MPPTRTLIMKPCVMTVLSTSYDYLILHSFYLSSAIILVLYSYIATSCAQVTLLMCVLFTLHGVNNECVYSNSDCLF